MWIPILQTGFFSVVHFGVITLVAGTIKFRKGCTAENRCKNIFVIIRLISWTNLLTLKIHHHVENSCVNGKWKCIFKHTKQGLPKMWTPYFQLKMLLSWSVFACVHVRATRTRSVYFKGSFYKGKVSNLSQPHELLGNSIQLISLYARSVIRYLDELGVHISYGGTTTQREDS